MNKSSVRRALTTLKKNGVIGEDYAVIEGDIQITIKVPFELTHPKKRRLKVKKVVPVIVQPNFKEQRDKVIDIMHGVFPTFK